MIYLSNIHGLPGTTLAVVLPEGILDEILDFDQAIRNIPGMRFAARTFPTDQARLFEDYEVHGALTTIGTPKWCEDPLGYHGFHITEQYEPNEDFPYGRKLDTLDLLWNHGHFGFKACINEDDYEGYSISPNDWTQTLGYTLKGIR